MDELCAFKYMERYIGKGRTVEKEISSTISLVVEFGALDKTGDQQHI